MDLSEDLLEAIRGDYSSSPHFSEAEKAAMRWAEVLTLKLYQGEPGRPPEDGDAMTELRRHYDDAQIVEITMVSGFFNFWNRFTDGLKVDIEDDATMGLFERSTSVDPADYVEYMRQCWWND